MAVDQHLHNLKVIDLLPKFCLGFVVDFDGQKVVILSEPLDEEEAKKRVAALQKFDHCRVVDGPVHVKLMKDDDLGFSPNMNFNEEKAKERGINRGDHHPVMPIGKPLSRYACNVSKEEIEVYHYICRRFLTSSMPDYQYSDKVVMLEMGDGLMLPYHFAQHDVLGFTEVLPEYKVATPGDAVIAKLVLGAEFIYTVSVERISPS